VKLIIVFIGEELHFCGKYPHSNEGKNHCVSCKGNINVRSKRV
jgi:hypothetical protein